MLFTRWFVNEPMIFSAGHLLRLLDAVGKESVSGLCLFFTLLSTFLDRCFWFNSLVLTSKSSEVFVSHTSSPLLPTLDHSYLSFLKNFNVLHAQQGVKTRFTHPDGTLVFHMEPFPSGVECQKIIVMRRQGKKLKGSNISIWTSFIRK